MPVHDKVQRYAQTIPDTPAVSIGNQQLSYSELWKRTLDIYALFCKKMSNSSSGQSCKIALILSNQTDFAPYYLASTLSPYVCAIIDPATPERTMRDILTQLQPDCVVSDDNQTVQHIVADMPCLYHRIGENLPANTGDDDIPSVEPVGEFFIGFTSGTTSAPKAYLRSKPAWRESLEIGYDIFHLHDSQRTLCPCPLSHGIGLYCLNETLHAGGSFFSLSKWSGSECAELIQRETIDRVVMVPSMLVSLQRHNSAANSEALFGVRHVVTAGAKLDIAKYHIIREQFPNARVQEYYGASEIGFMAVSLLDGDSAERVIDSVGMPFESVRIFILDEQGNEVPRGETGTICVDSSLISDGYLWGDDGSGIFHHGYASVGDLGFVDADGRLHVVGRKGGMVITGGFNVYVSEVEMALKGITGISEAAVVSVPDEYLGNRLIAFVEADDTGAIMNECSQLLPRYKIPREWYQVSEWPLTSSGKIRKPVLQSMREQEDTRLVTIPTTI